MTLARCRANLIGLLADEDNRVVALSGKWGTGKTHLWAEVQNGSNDEKIRDAVHVSLFGSRSIPELKLKIAQAVLPKLEAGGALAESIRNFYGGAKRFLKSIHSGFSALDELALVAAPMMIKGRFIVIDDIERKHESLSIEEILGFIDDCVQNLDCRILLILNSDELDRKNFWELFREKVIDQELRLDTSPSEAFDIAIGLTRSDFADHIRPSVEACQVTNIRIVRKIIRVVNHLLERRGALPPEVLARVIPSTTLLSAIYYKGLEDGPHFDFVLNFESHLVAAMKAIASKKLGVEETPEATLRERWRLLMDKLGIRGTDEFEVIVVDYLKSGLLEGEEVGRIVDRYIGESRNLAARARVQDFFERYVWRPEVSEAELLEELRAMLPVAGLLDMFTVTALHDKAMQLPGGAELGGQLIGAWLMAFRERHPPGQEPELDEDYNFFRRPLQPDIAREIVSAQARRQSNLTLLGVCRRVREESGWGKQEETLMRSLTHSDYESAIRSATGADLKLLLLQSMHFLKNRDTYDSHFGSASECFLEACQAIVQSDANSRLSKLIRDVFEDGGMVSELTKSNAPAAVTTPTSDLAEE